MFKTRLLSGIVLVLVALLTICSGGTVLYMTVLCLSLIGAGELFRVMKVREDKWNLLEITGYAGVVIFYQIPIRQETVEICEFFDLNPYQLGSTGSLLLAAPDGNRLVLDLKQQGIPAVVIGKATADNDRVVINEDERRFLEPLRAGVQVYGMEFKI